MNGEAFAKQSNGKALEETNAGNVISERQLLQSALQNIDEGLSVFDSNLRLTVANARFGEVLDLPDELIQIGTKFEDIIRYKALRGDYGDGDVEIYVKDHIDVARDAMSHDFERTLPTGRTVRIVGNPMPDGGFVTTYTDVTDRREAERALKESQEMLAVQLADAQEARDLMEAQSIQLVELAEDQAGLRERAVAAEHAKGEFLATMSHEIRTPLTGILGMSELLLRETLTPSQKEKARQINESGNMLLSILNDVLDQAKLESGKLTLEKLDFYLPDLVSGSIELLQPKAREKSLHFDLDLAAEVPEGINTDPVRLRQVLLNLLGNAVKFTSEGEIKLSVGKISPDDGNEFLEFRVKDGGIGIKEEVLDKLFQRFEQAETSTSRKYGGSGLGLSICRELVTLMGGQIGVESTLGEGSTFWFTIPLNVATTEVGPAASETVSEEPRASRELRLLLAEDNKINQMLVQQMIGAIGHQITIAKNGLEAVEKSKADEFDFVLMDIRMPVMDGIDATKEIRALGNSVPIIAFTADAMHEHLSQYLEAGMNAVATKPIQLRELLTTVDDVLKERIHRWEKVNETASEKAPEQDDGRADDQQSNERVAEFLRQISAGE